MTQKSSLLVDTALEMMAEIGLEAITLTDVARRAGVSRATAYREFGDKDGMVGAVANAEVGRMVAAAYQAVELFAPLRELVYHSTLFAIDYLRRHPVICRVRDHEPAWLLNVAIDHEGSKLDLVEAVGAATVPLLASRADVAELAVEPAQAAEIVVRTVLSHTLLPRSGLTDEQIGAAAVRAVLGGPS